MFSRNRRAVNARLTMAADVPEYAGLQHKEISNNLTASRSRIVNLPSW
ncbi:unnamed protein product [marine sediment metagenome]|uniref:Uncharacterized protein n=1 Tax=marine sediment metagenome TaxID=412755 RepID=X0YHC9_9ZZZZ